MADITPPQPPTPSSPTPPFGDPLQPRSEPWDLKKANAIPPQPPTPSSPTPPSGDPLQPRSEPWDLKKTNAIPPQPPMSPSGGPLQPPPQPLDLKKAGMPPLVLLGIVVIGFTLAGFLFSSLAKSIMRKSEAKKKLVAAPAKVKTVIEVKPSETLEPAPAVKPEPPKDLPNLTLGGILFSSSSGSYALINGKVVPEGSKVSGVTVVKVLRDKVELSFEGRKFTMRSF